MVDHFVEERAVRDARERVMVRPMLGRLQHRGGLGERLTHLVGFPDAVCSGFAGDRG